MTTHPQPTPHADNAPYLHRSTWPPQTRSNHSASTTRTSHPAATHPPPQTRHYPTGPTDCSPTRRNQSGRPPPPSPAAPHQASAQASQYPTRAPNPTASPDPPTRSWCCSPHSDRSSRTRRSTRRPYTSCSPAHSPRPAPGSSPMTTHPQPTPHADNAPYLHRSTWPPQTRSNHSASTTRTSHPAATHPPPQTRHYPTGPTDCSPTRRNQSGRPPPPSPAAPHQASAQASQYPTRAPNPTASPDPTDALLVLFAALGSVVEDEKIDAPSVYELFAGSLAATCARIVTDDDAPAANTPCGQCTVSPSVNVAAANTEHRLGVDDTNVAPCGNTSSTTNPALSDGPNRFFRQGVINQAARHRLPRRHHTRHRHRRRSIRRERQSELVAMATDAVFEVSEPSAALARIEPIAVWSGITVTWKLTVVVSATVPSSQVIVFGAVVQPTVASDESNVTPSGRVSVASGWRRPHCCS